MKIIDEISSGLTRALLQFEGVWPDSQLLSTQIRALKSFGIEYAPGQLFSKVIDIKTIELEENFIMIRECTHFMPSGKYCRPIAMRNNA
ncbi:MAG: hypothetical protein KGN79_16530 [Acidobacteriota bacterium]|nr:hypothetical protein [Acidobacteriota bacterium]